jgi:hypothetical protein
MCQSLPGPWPTISAGRSPATFQSKLTFATDSVRLKGDGFGVATDWRLAFDASGEQGLPLGQSDSKSTYVSFVKAGEAKASVSLDMDGKYWARGPVSAGGSAH